MATTSARRSYHHGDLRRAVLDAALALIAEGGPSAVTLRELARRAGVSHAAPAHHFGDKAGVLTAVATEGFRKLGDALRRTYEDTGSFLEVGVAYVRFALDNRAYFDVMFRPDLYRSDDPDLVAARDYGGDTLARVVDVAGGHDSFDARRAAVAAWSLVHGFSTLWLNGALPPDLVLEDPEDLARSAAAHLFGGGGRRGRPFGRTAS